MMRSPRVSGGSVIRAASRVVSGKDAFSSAAGSSTARGGGGGGGDVRTVRVPSPPPPAAVTSPTFASGAAVWSDWETANPELEREEGEGEEELGLDELWLFETVPSSDEVEAAIWNLQQMSIPSTIFPQERDDDRNSNSNSDTHAHSGSVEIGSGEISTEPESDWIEPTSHVHSEVSSSSANNHQKALEAFHLLKVNPSIQRMVVSLSSDKAVWDAVMKNEAVQEIKKSLCEGISEAKFTDNTVGPVEGIVSALGSMFSKTKATMMDLIQKVTTFVNNFVRPSEEKKGDDKSEFFADAVKSSLMLSVFVFLIVIAGRLQK